MGQISTNTWTYKSVNGLTQMWNRGKVKKTEDANNKGQYPGENDELEKADLSIPTYKEQVTRSVTRWL